MPPAMPPMPSIKKVQLMCKLLLPEASAILSSSELTSLIISRGWKIIQNLPTASTATYTHWPPKGPLVLYNQRIVSDKRPHYDTRDRSIAFAILLRFTFPQVLNTSEVRPSDPGMLNQKTHPTPRLSTVRACLSPWGIHPTVELTESVDVSQGAL